MKARLDAKLFRKAFTTAARACPEATAREVYRSVLACLSPDGSTLSATDGELGARLPIDGVSCPESALLLIPAKWMGDLLKSLDPDQAVLDVELDGHRLAVSPTADPAAFPDVEASCGGPSIEVDAADLLKAIRRTSYAVAEEGSRGYALAGLKVEWTADTLVLVGFDGYRLARQEVPAVALGPSDAAPRIIPPRLAKFVRESLSDASGPVELSFPGESSARLACDGAVISGRLVEGRYPDWRKTLGLYKPSARV
jgi:DNA polymerase III sliding clamp (beta) subunit (PCNA family)